MAVLTQTQENAICALLDSASQGIVDCRRAITSGRVSDVYYKEIMEWVDLLDTDAWEYADAGILEGDEDPR